MHIALGAYIDGLDVQALTWLNQFIGRSSVFDALVATGLNNSLLKLGPVAFVICWFWFDAHPNRERRREELLQALLIAVGALLLGRVLALGLPFRLRPAYRVDLDLIYPLESGLRTWSAFPSDHAVIAFALAVALARLSPLVGVWAFAHAAVIICFPRVYFGLHHPSDVIGGALIGAAVAMGAAWMPVRWAKNSVLIKLEHKRPAMFYAFGFILLFEIMTMFDGLRSSVSTVFGTLRHVGA
jgi:undecaprenyl-diphosphatase